MKKIIFISLVVMAVTWTFGGCDHFPVGFYRFYFKNDSNSDISISYSLNYPDTLLYDGMQIFRPRPMSEIPIDSKKKWEDVINQDILGKKLQVYVFSVVVNSTNWPTVRDSYLVKKRYEITADQLKTMNYVIAYP